MRAVYCTAINIIVAPKRESLSHWRGKTVYRKCTCGETCFDAVYASTPGDSGDQYLYRCRNCNTIHLFNLKER